MTARSKKLATQLATLFALMHRAEHLARELSEDVTIEEWNTLYEDTFNPDGDQDRPDNRLYAPWHDPTFAAELQGVAWAIKWHQVNLEGSIPCLLSREQVAAADIQVHLPAQRQGKVTV